MERNGLTGRSREKKIGYWIGGISTFFVVSFFLVPAYLPSNSVPELSGRANSIDYFDEDSWGNTQQGEVNGVGHNQSEYGHFSWSELDPYAGFIYAFGDLNCHNKAERSWVINGNQMPVCVRDVGIFLGLAIGGFIFSRRGLNRWTIRDSLFSIFPDQRLETIYRSNYRNRLFIFLIALSVLPMALDGFTQMLTDYESTAFMRLITGTPFGLFLGLIMSCSFAARPKFFETDAGNVVLPSGTKFSMVDESEE